MPVEPKSSRERVQTYRERMRARGYRLIQHWVPDTRTDKFVREARRQSRLLAQSDRRADDQAFIDAASVFNELPEDDIPEHRQPE